MATYKSSSGGRGGFRESSERKKVLIQQGSRGEIREGITREQVKRFFDRRDAVNRARQARYTDGSNAQGVIDNLVSRGFRAMKKAPGVGRYELFNRRTGESAPLRNRIEQDYARVRLNITPLNRTY